MKLLIKFSTLLLILAFCSCKKEQKNTMSVSDFPLKVGNSWTYQRSDTVSASSVVIDTTVTTIPATTTFNGRQAYLWVETSKHSIDTSYVYLIADSVIFLNKSGYIEEYYFPILVGSSWVFYNCTSISSQEINGKNYSNVYTISRNSSLMGDYTTEDIKIVPGIGIVSQWRNEFGQGANVVYKKILINYHLM